MTTAPAATLGPRQVSAAVRATYVAFIVAGFGFANWASRIPQVRDRLHLSPADLGLVLLAIAIGALFALPMAGLIVHRIGSGRTVIVMAILLAVGLAVAGAGYLVNVIPLLIGLFLFGFATGAWDVAMNVQGAMVERHLGRAIMPRFHAGYSAGTVAGAFTGVLMVAGHVSVTVHLIAVAAVIASVVPIAARAFVAEAGEGARRSERRPRRFGTVLARWLEPRTLLIGVVVLAFAFTEGSGNDWINVALIDDYHAPAVVGTLGFATFLVAETAARWFGTGLLDRFGRVTVLRGLSVVAIVGLALFVLGPVAPVAFVGALLWGAGAALGFPVGMSAAADDPAAAPGRVSVVASVGYCGFLAGPPVIGLLGDHLTVRRALVVVAVLLALATMLTQALRPPAPTS